MRTVSRHVGRPSKWAQAGAEEPKAGLGRKEAMGPAPRPGRGEQVPPSAETTDSLAATLSRGRAAAHQGLGKLSSRRPPESQKQC